MIDVHCYLPSSQVHHNLTLQCEITALPSTLFNHKQYVPEAFRTRESSRESGQVVNVRIKDLMRQYNFYNPKEETKNMRSRMTQNHTGTSNAHQQQRIDLKKQKETKNKQLSTQSTIKRTKR
jgi:hypothetical protein